MLTQPVAPLAEAFDLDKLLAEMADYAAIFG
jgi:hypothetical protein